MGSQLSRQKNLDNPDSWVTIRSDFKSKAERDRYMKELLEYDFYIERLTKKSPDTAQTGCRGIFIF